MIYSIVYSRDLWFVKQRTVNSCVLFIECNEVRDFTENKVFNK